MSTQHLWRHRDANEGPPTAPARAFGALERRFSRRRLHAARGTGSPTARDAAARRAGRPIYWVGDDRETTQGDW